MWTEPGEKEKRKSITGPTVKLLHDYSFLTRFIRKQ